ncbi:MAG TPA: glutamate racemase [Patescibacteria group bacterium]|jgi:glutamate racemase|nr:glutamate racemase [Patescibacteria group bacterium]
MKIGIFDSGLGGLLILRSIIKKLPQYDYVYLGDTKRIPYGSRTQNTIHSFTRQAVAYLLKNNCQLVVLACNTASSSALRKIQREYLPKNYPNRRVLGIIIPTAEQTIHDSKIRKIGILATSSTVDSKSFLREFKKLNPALQVYQSPAPRLVPLLEAGKTAQAVRLAKKYLKPLLKKQVDAIVLGCTHYSLLADEIQKIAGRKIKIVDQTDFIARKLAEYLARHPEIKSKLEKKGKLDLRVTKISEPILQNSKAWFGANARLKLVKI